MDHHQVQADVRNLYEAGAGRAGTDEITFCGIIMNRSDTQLRAIAQEYHRKHRQTLDQAIYSEFSGHMQYTLLYVVDGALHPNSRDARLIHQAMEGLGTKDERLTYRIIRSYWWGGPSHMEAVKQAYYHKYKEDLIKRVKSETSGDYERLLVRILRGH